MSDDNYVAFNKHFLRDDWVYQKTTSSEEND